jgi:alkylation response protein AidB-like acyl-CoA dehydrogenase
VTGAVAEFTVWLDENFDPEDTLVSWRTRLFDARWACPSWPARWGGRDLSDAESAACAALLSSRDVPGPPDSLGVRLAAPTLLAHGTDDVRDRFLGVTVTGRVTWCQLFSEPGAGSDLASLSSRAERDGDQWVVTGQKVWTTSAHLADLGLLLARTRRGADRHDGITCFVVPMRQSGVTVRPLRQMNDHSSFNEVFLDGAVVPAGDVVGDIDDGWRVALTTLAHERRLAPATASARPPGGGRVRDEAASEVRRMSAAYAWYPQRAGRSDLLVTAARAAGREGDARVRQSVAQVATRVRAARWTAQRARDARAAGRAPGAEGSVGKLHASQIARAAAEAHTTIAGASGMLTGADAPGGGVVAEVLVSVPAVSIAGGTDEIQRTIIGERVLGLPKEPSAPTSTRPS